MKKSGLLCILLVSTCIANAAYNWQQLTSMPSNGRVGARGFAINDKLYYGLGDFDYAIQYDDMWEYDPGTDTWTQKANIPGSARVSATAFSINNYGYAGLGWSSYNMGAVVLTDLYKYDPVSNAWSVIAPFPGNGQFNTSTFVINGYAFVGMGGSPQRVMYRYDPVNDTWTQVSSFPGAAIQSTSTFVLNDLGFVCGGWDGNGVMNQLWAYDPITDTWTVKANAPVARASAISFVIDDIAFYGTGGTGNFGGTVDMNQYDIMTDTWTPAPNFPGLPLNGFQGLAIGNTAYGFGGGDAGIGYYTNELWQFSSTSGLQENTVPHHYAYYDGSNKAIVIRDENVIGSHIQLFTIEGKQVLSKKLSGSIILLSDHNLTEGNYILSIGGPSDALKSSEKITIY